MTAELCSGKTDVGDQIEDEEQVLGLKNDKTSERQDEGLQEEKDGGIEMEVRSEHAPAVERAIGD